MSSVIRFFRIIVVVVVFGFATSFAVKNAEIVAMRYYFGFEWQAPLVLILLVFFAAGACLGVVACLGNMFRQRREIAALNLKLRGQENSANQAGPGLL